MYRALSIGIAAVAAVLLLLGQGPSPVEAAPTTFYVTSNADSGPGTFRNAVDQANSCYDSVIIKFLVGGPINLQSSVEYDCPDPITLSGRLTRTTIQGSNIVSTGDADIAGCYRSGLFESIDGADVTLLNLIFQNNTCGNGVSVYVEEDYDTTYVTLNNVILRDNDRNGLYVYEDDESCDYSDQSIVVTILYSTASGNGDNGVRVREYGNGDLTANVRFSQFRDNGFDDGGDGLLLTEECDGDLDVTTLTSSFNDNEEDGIDMEEWGSGDANASLSALDASRNGEDGVDFDETDESEIESLGTTDADEVDEAPRGGDSGPEAATCDGDDLTLTITGGVASGNDEDGLDIAEDDCGTLYATFTTFAAIGNDDDGVDLWEENGGDVVVRASATQTSNNGRDDEDDDGNGLQIYEDSWGSVDAELSAFTANANGSFEGDGDGIEIEEWYDGSATLTVRAGTILTNFDDGVDVEENECGSLDASFSLSGVNLNADAGFDLYQYSDCGGDFGELSLTATTVFGNADGSFDFDGVVLD